MRRLCKLAEKLLHEESGMEMTEWAIVAAVFAVSCAVFWGDLSDTLGVGITKIDRVLGPGWAVCETPPCGIGGGLGPGL
jgi:hypothetical protein